MSLPVQMEIFLALGKDNQRRVSSPKFRLLNRIAEIPPAPSKRGVNRLFYRNWKFNNASFLVYARGIFFYWINGFIENLSAILNARFYRIFFCALKNFLSSDNCFSRRGRLRIFKLNAARHLANEKNCLGKNI